MWTFLALEQIFSLLFLVSVSAQEETTVFRLILNTEDKGDYFVILTDEGDILFPEEEFLELGLKIPEGAKIKEGYISFHSLSPEIEFKIDEKDVALLITADPKLFERQVIDLSYRVPEDADHLSEDTAFFNYSVDYRFRDEFNFDSLRIPFNLGIRWKDFLGYSNFSYTKSIRDEDFRRQSTNITIDDPGRLQRYILGDFFAHSGELGGGGSLGGLSISKNFSLKPYFIRSPGVEISGVLETPSEVKIYVNDILQRSERLGPGEFEFCNLPVTGKGKITTVIKDAYGREERIIAPFYTSSGLLTSGLDEYSYNLGLRRRKDEYSGLTFVGFHRRGLTDKLTGGLRAEVDSEIINLGATATSVLGTIGEIEMNLATSWMEDRCGLGYSLSLFFPKVIGMNTQVSLRGFSEGYGNISIFQKPRSELVLGLAFYQRRIGFLFSNYLIQNRYDGNDQRGLSLSYSKSIPKIGSLFLFGQRKWEKDKVEDEASIRLHFPMGGRRTLGLVNKVSKKRITRSLEFQKGLPSDVGLRCRFLIEGSEEVGVKDKVSLLGQTHLEYHGPYGVYSADYRRDMDQNNYGLGVSGGVAIVKGHLYPSRPIHDGFAVVKVDGLEGVRVELSNRKVGQTGKRGELLVPGLISYCDNRLSIEPEDLPFNYSILKRTKFVSVPYRSGGVVEFDVTKLQVFEGKLFLIENGKEVPAEYARLEIEVEGKTLETVVGKDGEFYLENIPAGRFFARLFKEDKEYNFELVIPESEDMVMDLGDICVEATVKIK